MHYQVSQLWKKPLPAGIDDQLNKLFANYRGVIFFRADDIGVLSNNFTRLIQTFSKYSVPLCLAVVPSWLTQSRWQELKNLCDSSAPLWCWHQHGWTHSNHEPSGKKCEFGESQNRTELIRTISRGKTRLEQIMGPDFTPAFTPPWNRCSEQALSVIQELGFAAISRSKGAKPPAPDGLTDFAVNIDLHTRKETTFEESWANLITEFNDAISTGTCGIMIHHQRMNEYSFVFLDNLLKNIVQLECPVTDFRKIQK